MTMCYNTISNLIIPGLSLNTTTTNSTVNLFNTNKHSHTTIQPAGFYIPVHGKPDGYGDTFLTKTDTHKYTKTHKHTNTS